MCQCHMSQIYFCFCFSLYARGCFTPYSSAYEKLNFIHESLRHISCCFPFFAVSFVSFCSLAAETLFFFRLPFSLFLCVCLCFFIFNTNPTLHAHLTETKMYVRANTKTSAIHNAGNKQNGTQLHCRI